MSNFKVSGLIQSGILYVYTQRDYIQLDPEYQRVSDIWTLEKRQLLIDSILNDFDIPKIYFHEFNQPLKINSKLMKYAIVDGKQRLETIWKFIDGDFELSNDFEFLADKSVNARGLTYKELSEKYPRLKIKFDATSLPIISIQTDDLDLIEEMFSRLNEAVPLNAPEKRNAFGGPVPRMIRSLAKHKLFKERIPFSNKRYRFLDVAVKFLFLESVYTGNHSKLIDTKKVYLDDFVKTPLKYTKNRTLEEIDSKTRQVLNLMANVFIDKDKLLKSTGMLSVYYLLFRNKGTQIKRQDLIKFEKLRADNKSNVQTDADIAKADYELLEFDKLAWAPNDVSSITTRYKILEKYLFPQT